jgi:hypothetical protein
MRSGADFSAPDDAKVVGIDGKSYPASLMPFSENGISEASTEPINVVPLPGLRADPSFSNDASPKPDPSFEKLGSSEPEDTNVVPLPGLHGMLAIHDARKRDLASLGDTNVVPLPGLRGMLASLIEFSKTRIIRA